MMKANLSHQMHFAVRSLPHVYTKQYLSHRGIAQLAAQPPERVADTNGPVF